MQAGTKSGIGKHLVQISGVRWSLGSLMTLGGSVLVLAAGGLLRGGPVPVAAVAAPFQAMPLSLVNGVPETASNHADPQRCDACHTFDAGFSHPTQIVPSMAVSTNFPLIDGKMACLTCHTEEAAKPHGTTGAGRGAMLRQGTSAAGFCASCHEPSRGSRRGFHASDLVRAHLQSSTWTPSPHGAMDSESTSCVVCHDGSLAKDAGGHASSLGGVASSGDHPIGVDYRSRPANHRTDEIRLVSMGALDRRIRLFDRSVGCGSCHSVYSGRKDLLVMPNIRSQLCLSCHSL